MQQKTVNLKKHAALIAILFILPLLLARTALVLAAPPFLLERFIGYGNGQILCPPEYVALGGGSHCDNGEFNVHYPISRSEQDQTPIGWKAWHRGYSTNDCKVYSICIPENFFQKGQLRVVFKDTGYGTGEVFCPTDFSAIGGGAYCGNGNFDVTYPMTNLLGWKEWHRGKSTNDCKVYAVCLHNNHPLAKNIELVIRETGYGIGKAECQIGKTVLGGGSFCSNGYVDFNYPEDKWLKAWKEWHRGKSTNDCKVYAICTSVPNNMPRYK